LKIDPIQGGGVNGRATSKVWGKGEVSSSRGFVFDVRGGGLDKKGGERCQMPAKKR